MAEPAHPHTHDGPAAGPPADPWLWQAATALAARAHRHQFRSDAQTPYASHTFRVCLTAATVFQCHDPVVLAACLLHDTIEDTTVDRDEIVDELSEAGRAAGAADRADDLAEQVASLVAAMTKDMRLPEAEREPAYDAQLARADWRARLIKLADVHDNLTDAIMSTRRGLGGKSIAKAADKARRAIALAEHDASPLMRRAVAVVRTLSDDASVRGDR